MATRRFRELPLGDPILFALTTGLAIFGIMMVYSAGVVDVPTSIVRGIWKQQLTWFALGIIATWFVLRVPIRWIEWATPVVYGVVVVLLLLTPIIGEGAGTAASTKSWINLGFIKIQPAELGKVAVVLMLARVLGEWRETPRTIWDLWKPIAVVMVPMALVMLQPDLGSSLVFAMILITTLFWAGTPLPTLFLLVSPVIGLFMSISPWVWALYFVLLCIFVLLRKTMFVAEKATVLLANIAAGTISWALWASLKPYQKNRFLVFLDPSIDPRGAGYNLIQSQVAIGSGGLLGKGFTHGTQKRLAFLPEQHTDFIFSVIGEEWGFLGVAAVLVTFGLIFWRLVRIAEASGDPYASLIPFGLFGSWFMHVLVNTGMVVGIMPITGIPLPFLSYGGSFLLINLLAVALVQRIAAESRRR